MHWIDKTWQCWSIAHNDRYIATMGTGVTVRDRTTLETVHHFTGLRWVHSGVFVNEDVLMVYTGEQKLFFFQISQKKLLWAVPRPRELAAYSNMCCCLIPGTEKVACVVRGKRAQEEHFLLVVDWASRELCMHRIPDCYRVVTDIVWTQEFGLSFLSTQLKGRESVTLYRIHRADHPGEFSILHDGEMANCRIAGYTGRYLLAEDHSAENPEAKVYPLAHISAEDGLKLGTPVTIPVPLHLLRSAFGVEGYVSPPICWADDASGLLAACHSGRWIGVYDLTTGKPVAEQECPGVMYGQVLDGRLLMGCGPGFCAEQLS